MKSMNVSEEDIRLFDAACRKVLNENCLEKGIGTLSERTMHAVVKNFYEPDESHQEVRIGRFIADIFRDNEITEIQTRNFNKLREKLKFFLPRFPVTLVYPIVRKKLIYWMDRETGEICEERKSPKTGSPLDAFRELYKIKMFLNDPGLSVCLLLVDADEYRFLGKNPGYRKYHTERYDRVPKKLCDEYLLTGPDTYRDLIPETLPENFTSGDLAKAGRVTKNTAGIILNVMLEKRAVERTGKKGNSYIYRRSS